MIESILEKFLGKEEFCKDFVCKPFNVDGKTVATDGHAAIFLDEGGEFENEEAVKLLSSPVRELMNETVDAKYTLPQLNKDDYDCEDCGAEGVRVLGDHIMTCRSCQGHGYGGLVRIAADYFDVRYILNIHGLPGLRLGFLSRGDRSIIKFYFEGGSGSIENAYPPAERINLIETF